jgi:hypothetical protein
MDGWDAAHDVVQPWIKANRPAVAEAWQGFSERGLLFVPPAEAHMFLPRPTSRELKKMCGKALDAYAIHAMMDALYDGLQFVACTKGSLIATAACLGTVEFK